MQRSLIIGLFSALLLVIFALKNSATVALDFIIGKPVQGSLSLILLVTLIIGTFVGLLLSYPSIQKLRKKISDHKSEITTLNNLLNQQKKESVSKSNEKTETQEKK